LLFSNFSKHILSLLKKKKNREINAASSEEAGSFKADAYELYHCDYNGVARATPLRAAESVIKLSRVPSAVTTLFRRPPLDCFLNLVKDIASNVVKHRFAVRNR
jgi:hypothetical protein